MRRLLLLALALTPSASIAQTPPTPEEMLSALNVAVAYVEYCGVEVPQDVAISVASAGRMLELELGLERAEADARYLALKELVVATPPDCDPHGPDLGPVLEQLGMAL